MSETYIQNLGHLTTLSGLLGGFMISVVFQLLAMPERKAGTFMTVLMALLSSGTFIVCAFLCSFLIIGSNSLMKNGIDTIPLSYGSVFAFAILAFAVGSLTFSGTIAFAGWLHSKLLGMVGFCVAAILTVAMITGAWVLVSGYQQILTTP